MTNVMKKRFDGFLPVVVDVETGGLDCEKHALLEIAAVHVFFEEDKLKRGETFSTHVTPYEGAKLDPEALSINRIDPYHPFRFAGDEKKALELLFEFVNAELKKQECRRALLVGHNAQFDLSFLQAAMRRCKIKQSPFHRFTTLDTASLGALIFGKTVLAKALKKAKISFNKEEAHSAVYDAEKTTDLFCEMVNAVSPPV